MRRKTPKPRDKIIVNNMPGWEYHMETGDKMIYVGSSDEFHTRLRIYRIIPPIDSPILSGLFKVTTDTPKQITYLSEKYIATYFMKID